MRTLELNKTKVWIIEPLDRVELLDSDGFKTGEYTMGYAIPKEVNLALYPSNGAIVEQIFGKDASYDMMAVSNDIVLTTDSLVFLTSPPDVNIYNTYNYRVSAIKHSLNTYNYGLRMRT